MNDLNIAEQRHQYWRGHVNACRNSGESRTAYCKQHQLVYHRFSYWCRKFRNPDDRAQLAPRESTGFAQVLASRCAPPSGLSLALPNGLVIQHISDTNVNLVWQLLEQL